MIKSDMVFLFWGVIETFLVGIRGWWLGTLPTKRFLFFSSKTIQAKNLLSLNVSVFIEITHRIDNFKCSCVVYMSHDPCRKCTPWNTINPTGPSHFPDYGPPASGILQDTKKWRGPIVVDLYMISFSFVLVLVTQGK